MEIKKGRKEIDNKELDKHPNPNYKPKNKDDKVYLMTRKYRDHKDLIKEKKGWKFHRNDRPKVYNIIFGKKK